jgi:hypothetical protein
MLLFATFVTPQRRRIALSGLTVVARGFQASGGSLG